jgi:CheY-like chemotaxis protein
LDRHTAHGGCGLASLCLLVAQARAQDYPDTFKKPETAVEFWAAMKYEISIGNFNLAAANLKGFLEKKPTDQELLEIEGKEGITAFLQLLNIPELRKDAAPLLARMSAVLQQHLKDPERIRKFVKNLSATPEERAFAVTELKRSGAFAIPYLVEMLRDFPDAELHAAILSAALHFKKDVAPALAVALDVDVPSLRVELIDLMQKRGDSEAVPFLWHLAGSPQQPDYVRNKARSALAYFLREKADRLPLPKVALTREANRYYTHYVKFADPAKVMVWQMQPGGKQFVMPPPVYSATQAEEYYGLLFARQALDLDPSYAPAQVVFLSLALDKAYERAGLDQPLEKGSPEIKNLLRSVNPDLITAVLERALIERRTAVALGAVHTLGELTEVRAARTKGKEPSALVQALNYPDRRVQMAAADALLHIPDAPSPYAKARIVEVLRRALAADTTPKAIVADPNIDRAKEVGRAAKQAGYEPVIVPTGREALSQLRAASDVDLILIDPSILDPDLPHLLGQLRSGADNSLVPVLITVAPERTGVRPAHRLRNLEHLAAAYRNVWVVPATLQADALKQALAERVGQASGKPLTEEERKNDAAVAMLWLKRMAVGEVAGYDVAPAEGAIVKALRVKELSPLAVAATGARPGRAAQRELAAVVIDPAEPPELRLAAAVELNRHIQHHGALLTAEQARAIEAIFDAAGDAKLRGNLALVIGSMRPSAAKTGARLQRYAPPPPTTAAPAEAKDEKEKPPEKPADKEEK